MDRMSPSPNSSDSENSEYDDRDKIKHAIACGNELVPKGNELNQGNFQLTNVEQFNFETGNIHIHNTEIVTEGNVYENLTSQTKLSMEIGKWEDSLYVETMAYIEAKEKLSEYGHVTLCGNAGDGKTAMAKHLMYQYEAERYESIIVHSPEDFKSLINTNKKQIVLIDDVFGTSGLDQDKVRRWKSLLLQWDRNHRIQREMPSEKTVIKTLLIFTSRIYIAKQIENEIQDILFFKELYIVFLSGPRSAFSLNVEEKKKILETFAKRRKRQIDIHTINAITLLNPSTHGFPHCVDLFTDNSNIFALGLRFFHSPLEFLRKEIKIISQTDQKKFLVLVLAMLQNGQINESDIEKDLEAVSKRLNLHKTFSINEIVIAAEQLVGSYFEIQNDFFVFRHPSLIDAVTYVFVEEVRDVQLIIQKSKFEFICERIKPKCVNKKSSDEFITILKSQYVHITKRFLTEIGCGNKSGVAASIFLDDTIFIEQLLNDAQENGFNIFFNEGKYDTAFIVYAVFYRKVEFCTSLLEKTLCQRKRINDFDRILSDAFIVACRQGILKLVEVLFIKESFLGNTISNPALFSYSFAFPKFSIPIIEAIVGSNFNVFKYLVDVGADINHKDSEFNSLLHCCAEFGECQTLEYLLNELGFDPNVKNCNYVTPLFYAKSSDAIRVLIKYGGDVNYTNIVGKTPVFNSKNAETAKEFIRQGCDVSHVDNERKLPIFDLVQFEDVFCEDLVTGMVMKGLDLSHVDTHGRSLLHHVAVSIVENKTILSCLHKLIPLVDPNITDEFGCTALHYAVGYSGDIAFGKVYSEDVALARTKVFLQYSNVDIQITNNNKRTALLETEFAKVAEELIKCRGSKNWRNNSNENPIEIMASNGVSSKTLIELLIGSQIDVWPLLKVHLQNIINQSKDKNIKNDIVAVLSTVNFKIPSEELITLVQIGVENNSLQLLNIIDKNISTVHLDFVKFLEIMKTSRSSKIVEKLLSLGMKSHSNFINDIAMINPNFLFDLVENDLLTLDILKLLNSGENQLFNLTKKDESILLTLLQKTFQGSSWKKEQANQKVDADLFCALIRNGVNVNVQNKYGHTALHILVCGTIMPPQEYIYKDPVYSPYSETYCFLRLPIVDTDDSVKRCVSCLLDNGANLNIYDEQGRLPIHLVNNPALAVLLLQKSEHRHFQKKDNNGDVPLIALTKNGAMSIYVYLQLKRLNANFRVKDISGATCLHHLIRYPEDELMVMKPLQHILENISINTVTNNGLTVLNYLMASNLDESVIESRMEFLFNNGFNICIADTIFQHVRHSGNALKLLYVYKAPIIKNTKHLFISGIIHMAKKSVLNCEILDYMLQSGLQVEKFHSDHNHILYYVLISAQSDDETFKLFRKLLKHGLKLQMSEDMLKDIKIPENESRISRRLSAIENIVVELGQKDQIKELKLIHQKLYAIKEEKERDQGRLGTSRNDFYNKPDFKNKGSDEAKPDDLLSFLIKCVDNQRDNQTLVAQFNEFLSKVDESKRSILINETIVKLVMHVERYIGVKFIHLLVTSGVDIKMRTTDRKTLLHFAIWDRISQYLIKCGADVNAEDEDGQTPLFYVQLDTNVHSLVSNGADINHRNKVGQTPLHCVDNLDVAKALVYLGADKNAKDNNGRMPIECNNNVEVRQFLIQSGCEIDIEALMLVTTNLTRRNINKDFISYCFSERRIYNLIQQSLTISSAFMLFLASSSLNTKFVIFLLDKLFECNIDPNVKNGDGNTAIHLLLEFNNYKDLKPCDIYKRLSYLLGKGANLFVKNSQNIPAFSMARSSTLAKLCFEHMKKTSNDSWLFETMLLIYACKGICLPEIVQHIKQLNGNIHVVDRLNRSVLHLAVHYSYEINYLNYLMHYSNNISIPRIDFSDLITTLRLCSFNFDMVDSNGDTALSIAWQQGKTDLIEILLSNGCNPSQLFRNGDPLFCCIRDQATLCLFIKNGVNLNIRNENIEFYLAKNKLLTIEILEALRKRNVKLDGCDCNGNTLLHYDIPVEVLKHLIKCVKNVNICNSEGKTPIITTCLRARTNAMSRFLKPEMYRKIEILLETGANPNILDHNNTTPLQIVDDPYIAEIFVINGGVASYSFESKASVFLVESPESENEMTKTMLYLLKKNLLTVTSLEYLYNKGANLCIRDSHNATLMHACCMFQNHDYNIFSLLSLESNNNSEISNLVLFLIEHGLSTNVYDNQGNTPLHTLLQQRVLNKSVLQCLLEHGADWSFINSNGKLAVTEYFGNEREYIMCMFAAYFNNAKKQYIDKKPLIWYFAEQTGCFSLDLLRESINHDIDLTFIETDGTSILDCVFKWCPIDLWESMHLLRRKVNIGIQNKKSGETCLHRLIRSCKLIIANSEQFKAFVCFLIENGVDINAADSTEMTAFDSFIRFELYKIFPGLIPFFISQGASIHNWVVKYDKKIYQST